MQTKSKRFGFWKEKSLDFMKSGMTQRAYCEKNKVKESSLDYCLSWIRKKEKVQGFVEDKPAAARMAKP